MCATPSCSEITQELDCSDGGFLLLRREWEIAIAHKLRCVVYVKALSLWSTRIDKQDERIIADIICRVGKTLRRMNHSGVEIGTKTQTIGQ
jgi:hypothetical protein